MNTQELQEIAFSAIPPEGTVGVKAFVEHTPGERLSNGLLRGIGGKTLYGAGWFDGLKVIAPVGPMFDNQADAYALIKLMEGEGGELWDRRQRRRAKLEELDAAESAVIAEAKAETKLLKKLAKKGVDIKEATGGGSSRRSRSKEKPLVSTQMRLRAEEQPA